MAILIPGKSVCAICQKVINEGDDAVCFSAFVPNELDPLMIFNDNVFHRHCFERHSLADKARARYAEMLARLSPDNRICAVCHSIITDPDDYITLHHLTEDPQDPLYPYNYLQFHRSHLPEWTELPFVYHQLWTLQASGRWKGKGLEWLLSQLETGA